MPGLDTYRTALPLFDTLRGERITVRPYHAEDAAALKEAVDESREHIRPWLPFADDHRTVAEARDWIVRGMAKWLVRDDLIMGIWETATGRFLGGIGLHPRDWSIGYVEIGYWLRQTAEGHGFMVEAVRLVTDYAFDHLAAHRVEIRCDARNRRSAGVAERLGFVREAHLRGNLRQVDGTIRDTLIFALLADDPRWSTQPLAATS
jgi:RimJ/RimL family protein N-acetyltransferase